MLAITTTIEQRLQTLLDATQRLSLSIDYQETLENIVRFVAERFATYALLDVVDEDGSIVRLAVAHSDPSRQPLVERIRQFNPPATRVDTHPVARAVARGEATIELIDDAWIARAAISSAHAETMHALEMRALLVVPVTNGRRVVGALTCALDRQAEHTFDANDLAFAQELGRRAGVAIDHARSYEHERHIAVTLQESFLPSRLPVSAALSVDAFYRPGRGEATIGGDWYDAFVLDDGRIALTIGDVVGKGLAAAVTMGRLRQAMQTAALLDPRADKMLEAADRTLQMEQDDLYATGLAALFDPATRTIEVACAGHPPPLVRRVDGAIEHIEVRGMMLGIGGANERPVARIVLQRGSMLVLFTDGLTELGSAFDDDEPRIEAQLLANPHIVTGRNPARALVRAATLDRVPEDDIAVVTAIVL